MPQIHSVEVCIITFESNIWIKGLWNMILIALLRNDVAEWKVLKWLHSPAG
jgi:hypothetical protein